MTHLRNFLTLCLTILLLASCTLPTTSEPDAVSPATPPPTPILRPSPTPAPLGTNENPLVLSLPPAQTATDAQIESANELAAELTKLTGYTIVVVLPESESKLVMPAGILIFLIKSM